METKEMRNPKKANNKTLNHIINTTNSNLKIRFSPDGIHFFNRDSGINLLVTEIHCPKNLWSTAPRHVSIALTNTCDLKCHHCYAPKNPAILDFEKLATWLTELDNNGCIGVGFGGGEPTLYPKLAEICSYATRRTRLAITLTTHAHRLGAQLIDRLRGNLHFVRISMDGVGSTYEAIRNRPFDDLIAHIIAIKHIANFGINYMVNTKTIKDLDAAVQLAKNLGASEFLLLPEESIEKVGGIDNKTFKALRKWVSGYNGKVPLTISEGHSSGFPICKPFNLETGLDAFAHIDASGAIKRTSYDSRGVTIQKDGIIAALNKLRLNAQEILQ
jgi:sulfatase maturation enzyme AslB (radical SAM superfamily)